MTTSTNQFTGVAIVVTPGSLGAPDIHGRFALDMTCLATESREGDIEGCRYVKMTCSLDGSEADVWVQISALNAGDLIARGEAQYTFHAVKQDGVLYLTEVDLFRDYRWIKPTPPPAL